ncbi:hypothetical protein [Candidatus Arsenophonus triatominarum]|uniref:hypothetical protein n=1 Tax=Candidatus Arsenophonus triatominarum TaxID=57911 RepID=UPI0007C5AAAC|nr:hypothetical protein [Candidatus Arsenophonus triatominarum]
MQEFIIFYIAQAGNTIDGGRGFIRTLAEKTPTYREDFITIAEQLEPKGEKRGYQLGRQDGVNEGLQQGEKVASRKIAKQLLANGAERSLIKCVSLNLI